MLAGTHRPGLDGLRAWAVIAVVAFHTGLLRAGWVGVDVFMALSGFLITRVIVGDLESPSGFRLRRFWARRARRLMPALLLLIAVVGLVNLVAPRHWPVPTRSATLGALTYTSNWMRIAGRQDYWSMFAAPGAFDHLWSLAVEEQFYVVWPLVALLAWRRGGRRLLQRVAIGGAVLFGVWQVVLASLPHTSIERLYVGTDTRAPSFLLGAAASLLVLHRTWDVARARYVLVAASVGLVAACVWLDGQSPVTFRGPLLAVGLLGAVAAAAAAQLDGSRSFDRLFVAGPLSSIGRWSYGIYLFHWPLVVLLRDRAWSPTIMFVAVGTLSVVLAAASYTWYERPIRDGGMRALVRRRTTVRWPRAVVVPATLALFVGSVVVAIDTARVPQPEIDAVREAALRTPLPAAPGVASNVRIADAPVAESSIPESSIPESATGDNDPVNAGHAGTTLATSTSDAAGASHTTGTTVVSPAPLARVLVVGDSVAYGLTDQLVEIGAGRGLEVAVRAAPGCTLSSEAADQNNLFSKDLCAYLWANLRRDVLTFRPDHVVMLFGGTWSPLVWHGERIDPCGTAGRGALLGGGSLFLADLEAGGAVVDIALPPRMAGDYESAGADAGACYADAYAALAAAVPGRAVLPLDQEVCPSAASSCPEAVRGVDMRSDGLHYTPAGGDVVVRWLFDQLR